MIEVFGKYNTAYCYTDILESAAYAQILAVCNLEAFAESKIRIMPDVHAGVGCTIGTTMTVTDKVVPNLVGVDIGCGMYTVFLGKNPVDFEKLDAAAHYIPCGRNVWEARHERFDLTPLRCYRHLKDSRRLERSLGTLGGGNHFIEVDVDEEGNYYLVIHSGSRNLGLQVAKHYQRLAVELSRGKQDYYRGMYKIINECKEAGREWRIEKELKKFRESFAETRPTVPAELAFLYDEFMEDYLHDLDICQKFALRNREKMAEILVEKADLSAGEAFHTIHNYIDLDGMILRKGAVSAKAGERLLIPINMRDGSLLCTGKGNPEWNCSAPHGAGRIMSRGAAFEKLTMEEYQKQMEGIYTTCVNPDTLDESPMAYKDMGEIIKNIEPTAEIVSQIKPVYNFKAAE